MKNLSVVIISRNEAHNIGACLRSVQGAGEIILVDQFSTDGTVEIAHRLGAQVFQEPWQGYARQKNSAIAKATKPWILSLDADERVTAPLWREMATVLNAPSDYDGFYVSRKNFFCGRWIRHSGWSPDYNLRLLRRGAGRFEEREVHERIVVQGQVGRLKHPIEHYTYRSVADYLERLERYSRLAAQEIASRGKRPCGWHTLVLRPAFIFLKMYLLKAGFLDGRPGLFLAVSYAYYTFLKYYRACEHDVDE